MKQNNLNTLYPNFPFRLPMLLDGATGTEMIKAGMPSGICPEAWILGHPEAVVSLQNRYIAAGADAVLAPTFGANRTVLARYALGDRTAGLNASLAGITQNTAKDRCLVGGDISPTGRFLFPVGDADFEELVSVYAEQGTALDSFVDFFMIETNMDLACVRAAVTGIRESSQKPIFVTMTVTQSGKTMSGDTPEACLVTLSALGIAAFGLNCSSGPAEMLQFLKPLFPLSLSLGIPLIAKPNAGPPDENGTPSHMPADRFARFGGEMLESGIFILGGCCGTDDRHIAALRHVIDSFDPEAFSFRSDRLNVNALASTNRAVLSIPQDDLPTPLAADEDFLDNAEEMADEYGFLYIRIDSKTDADLVLEAAPFLPAPLAVCGEIDAVSYFRRRFCGKVPVI